MPTIWSSSGKLAASMLTPTLQLTPPSKERATAMLRVVAPSTVHATYAEEVALVAPGRNRGIEACSATVPLPVASVAALDQVAPASSENAALMVEIPVFEKFVQLTMMRP